VSHPEGVVVAEEIGVHLKSLAQGQEWDKGISASKEERASFEALSLRDYLISQLY
jgi:hypothetical protein